MRRRGAIDPNTTSQGPITINRELMPKRLELLKEAFPRLTSIGYLANPQYGLHAPQLQEMEAAAQALGLKLIVGQAIMGHGRIDDDNLGTNTAPPNV